MEAASHGTSDVGVGVAYDVAVVAVLSHGEQEEYGDGHGVGGSRSWLCWSRGSLARIVVSSEPQRAAEACAPYNEKRSKRLPSTVADGVSSDEASVEWLEPPLWSERGLKLRRIAAVGPRVYPDGGESDGKGLGRGAISQ